LKNGKALPSEGGGEGKTTIKRGKNDDYFVLAKGKMLGEQKRKGRLFRKKGEPCEPLFGSVASLAITKERGGGHIGAQGRKKQKGRRTVSKETNQRVIA